MKRFVNTLLIIALPAIALSQIDEKKRERALFEVNSMGETAYITDINTIDVAFDDRQADRIASDMMEKEGIFGVELLNENKMIRVFHMSYIDVDGLKSFILPHVTSINVEESVVFEF